MEKQVHAPTNAWAFSPCGKLVNLSHYHAYAFGVAALRLRGPGRQQRPEPVPHPVMELLLPSLARHD